jgi:predicted PurR-regulated permease PerM
MMDVQVERVRYKRDYMTFINLLFLLVLLVALCWCIIAFIKQATTFVKWLVYICTGEKYGRRK